jgi:2'-hydroxyisoflavone reductase
MIRTLVVGGTGFLGSAIVSSALAAGHEVSILTRGQTTALAGVTPLVADRFGPMAALQGQDFDLVFDTCAFVPGAVEHLLKAVQPRRYVMISSVSVHDRFDRPDLTEASPVPEATADDMIPFRAVDFAKWGQVPVRPESYGPLKRSCELAAITAVADRAIILRAGLLVGAGDRSDRLTWWVRRLDQGGRIPVPTDRKIQCIDVRDVADFAVKAAVADASGIFNVTSTPFDLFHLFSEIQALSGTPSTLVPLPDQAFVEAKVGPWMNLPLWLPDDPDHTYFFDISTTRARTAGLTTRPLDQTLCPLLDWDRARRTIPLATGLTPAQEALLLAA